MTYTAFGFYLFLVIVLLIYYTVPLRIRWVILLAASGAFYLIAYRTGWWIVLLSALLSYGAGLLLQHCTRYRRLLFGFAVILVSLPWFFIKNGDFLLGLVFHRPPVFWIVPLGISFYTLQILAYLADLYQGNIKAEKNPAKYMLFLCFFPQMIQGPIPRYSALFPQLVKGHRFDEACFVKGCHLLLWGFF